MDCNTTISDDELVAFATEAEAEYFSTVKQSTADNKASTTDAGPSDSKVGPKRSINTITTNGKRIRGPTPTPLVSSDVSHRDGLFKVAPVVTSSVHQTRDDPVFIIIAMATTGLCSGPIVPHITQMSAIKHNGNTTDFFNKYVLPRCPVSPTATLHSGISVTHNVMYLKDDPVTCVPLTGMLDAFIDFISVWGNNVILMGHFATRFDFRILIHCLNKTQRICRFRSVVNGFIDTLPLLKKKFPGRASYNQNVLAADILKLPFNNSPPPVKVINLSLLLGLCDLPMAEVMKQLKPLNRRQVNSLKRSNFESLRGIIESGVMSTANVRNIADSGINMTRLRSVYSDGGVDSLRDLFVSKQNDGVLGPRKCKNLLHALPTLYTFFTVQDESCNKSTISNVGDVNIN
uniref:ORF62 n=1 Tax=Malaco herpesvirus 4 TaxID=3031800 RepID=A0AA48SFF5_9VIRU|nr:TPA_asm: ORF62 [Malaco herpesvirus 4]